MIINLAPLEQKKEGTRAKAKIRCLSSNEKNGNKRMFEIVWNSENQEKKEKEILNGENIKTKYGAKFLLGFYERAFSC